MKSVATDTGKPRKPKARPDSFIVVYWFGKVKKINDKR